MSIDIVANSYGIGVLCKMLFVMSSAVETSLIVEQGEILDFRLRQATA